MQHYVVMIGYRQQLAAALHKRHIPYSIWGEKPLKARPLGVDHIVSAPFSSAEEIIAQLFSRRVFPHRPTHVIAGSEAAVFPAAALRRFFAIEHYPDSLLARVTDKEKMKQFLTKHSIPMTKFIPHSSALTAAQLEKELGLPVVIKNRRGSGGRDMIFAHSGEEIAAAMASEVLYERFVDAEEGSIESFVLDGTVIFSNITEYFAKKIANILPAPFPAQVLEEIQALNLRVIKALNITSGLLHLEYYRSKDGILFGEIALRPPGGYIMELMHRAYGFDPWDLFIDVELKIPRAAPKIAKQCTAGCVVFHPGEGRVRAIQRPRREEFSSLVKTVLKVKQGAFIGKRYGVSEDVGYCIFCADEYQMVAEDCRKMQSTEVIVLGAVVLS
jgi:hypothetical protein